MNNEVTEQVKEYVYKNYRAYKNRELMIVEHENHFSIRSNKDGAPLVLGKSII
jgi:hypothetical protein